MLENSSNHISEQHVDGPIILATEYKFTVQTKVRPFNPAHAPMQFMRGQQRHTSPPISEPIGKPVSGPNKKDQPLSPIRGDKLNLPTKVGNKHTVQTKMEPSNPAQGLTRLTLGQQSHTSLPISEPIGKPVLGPNKKDHPSSPLRYDKLTLPMRIENKQTVETKVEPSNKYKENPSNPVHDQTYSLPIKNHRVVDEKQDKPSTLVRDHRYKSPIIEGVETKNYIPLENKRGKVTYPVHDRPEQVEEFISNVQAGVSRPTNPGFLSRKNEKYVEPYTVAKTRWEGPSKREWALPPTQATPLFGPTNDVGEALNTFKEVVRSAPKPQNNFNYTDSKAPIRGRNTGAIDSREAQRRYANPNPSARPSVNYIGTITSTEAAHKYGGTPV